MRIDYLINKALEDLTLASICFSNQNIKLSNNKKEDKK